VLNQAPRYEGVLGEWRYSSTHSLISALDGGEWSASLAGRFTPRERAPVTYWIGGWVGPRNVLDAVVKRKIPSLRRESNPRTPITNSRYKKHNETQNADITFKVRFLIFCNRHPHEVCTLLCIFLYSSGLRAGSSEIRVPAGIGNFSLHHHVQTGSVGHPSFLSNVYRRLFFWG
jgi:hypothetical protein